MMKLLKKVLKTIVKIILWLGLNLIIHGFCFYLYAMPYVDFKDGYFNPSPIVGIIVLVLAILIIITQIDLILMTIHHLLEDKLERFLPKFYLGIPVNHFFAYLTAEIWT